MSKLRILIVEDEPFISMDLADLLVEMGHAVCGIEATEDAAIAAGLKDHPDLLLVDLNLRQGSGVNVVNTLLKNGFIPHIFMSGDRFINLDLPQDSVVLRKPFSEADLAGAIEAAITPVG